MTPYANIKEVLNSIKMKVEYLGTDSRGVRDYKCVLKFEGRQLTVVFSIGQALKGEPTVEDVVEVLVNKVSKVATIKDLREFALMSGNEMNTKEEYNSTLKIYNGRLAESKNTLRLLGNMERVKSLYNYFSIY